MDKLLKNVQYYWKKTNRFHRVIVLFVIIELRLFPLRKLGFTCQDPTLSYPFTGDTINWKWLMGVCLFLPLVVMLIVERTRPNTDKGTAKSLALRWYKEYLFGYLVNLTIVQGLKYIVGAPRPHFFDTCKPEEAKTCENSEYISSYTCTASKYYYQSDQSFPSGHTSLAVHAGVFIAYYIYKRCSRGPIAQTAAAVSLGTALWCSVSRIWDRRHHLTDVLAGTTIGLVVLLYTTHHLCQNFKCSAFVTADKSDKKLITSDSEEKEEIL